MLLSLLSVALAGLMTCVGAQNGSYPYTISANDPKASPALRNTWCITQEQSCRTICGGTTQENTCTASTLTYSCVCTGGFTPNITQYNSTLPFFECQIYQQNCITANPTDERAQQACNDIPCGGKAATEAAVTSTASATPSATSSSSPSSESSPSAADAAASSTSSAATADAPTLHVAMDPYLSISALVVSLMFLGGIAL